MSILQSKESELRYMKRKNLEQEARMIGNNMRDIIRSYGTDCIYSKLDTSIFENYKANIDQNLILQRAYGYNMDPDYSCSARMISYMEVEQDIFQLNKFGLNPNMDVNFYFDSTDFACALATKCGQYQEYKIEETEFDCEVPEFNDNIRYSYDPETKELVASSYVSSDLFPYKLGLGYAEFYKCDILSGKLSVQINGYELDKETTVICDPYEHTDFMTAFPANKDLYKSFSHTIKNDEYLQTLIFLTYKVSKATTYNRHTKSKENKYILHGKIHGGVLFYNIFKLGKYLEKIHPEVGDLITIDFPDENNPERYEITDCYDKSLQSDGISPLLHKYIWKCKARRYVNNADDVPETEYDARLQEKLDFEKTVDEEVTKKISGYKDNEDAVYGGYELDEEDQKYDKQMPSNDNKKRQKFDYIEDGTALNLLTFASGSKLVTTGYELLFINSNGDAYQITTEDHVLAVNDACFESGLRYLKASKDMLVFVNIEGTSYKIIEDEQATKEQLEMCLNSMFDKTLDTGAVSNKDGNNFYVFKESKTLLWATSDALFCKLASNNVLYRIA